MREFGSGLKPWACLPNIVGCNCVGSLVDGGLLQAFLDRGNGREQALVSIRLGRHPVEASLLYTSRSRIQGLLFGFHDPASAGPLL